MAVLCCEPRGSMPCSISGIACVVYVQYHVSKPLSRGRSVGTTNIKNMFVFVFGAFSETHRNCRVIMYTRNAWRHRCACQRAHADATTRGVRLMRNCKNLCAAAPCSGSGPRTRPPAHTCTRPVTWRRPTTHTCAPRQQASHTDATRAPCVRAHTPYHIWRAMCAAAVVRQR